MLEQLDDFALIEAAVKDFSRVEFDDWCRVQLRISPGVRRNRMRIVRNFCLYRQRTCPNSFIPNADLFPATPNNPTVCLLRYGHSAAVADM